MKPTFITIILCLFCSALTIVNGDQLIYNNEFAVHIPHIGEDLVQQIAEKYGFKSLGQVTANL